MAGIEPHLADIWIALIAFFLLYYAAVDGVVLGLGMLTLITPSEKDRDTMMGALLSTWHSNQTWLVIVGGMMFGAFPLFYGLVLSALYIPILFMLFGFVIRGVALDYWEEASDKRSWELAFGLGSLLASVAQGFALGGLLGGIRVENERFAGGILDWANPFAALVTVGVLFGYAMLGANFMILKMEGELQQRGYRYSVIASLLTVVTAAGVYLWMLTMYPHMYRKWITTPEAYSVLLFPSLALLCSFALLFSLWKRCERAPLILNVAVIFFSFAGVSLGLYPYMIPNVISEAVTISGAAASSGTLKFMLIVVGSLIPIILIYTTYEFWVFRGKVSAYYKREEE